VNREEKGRKIGEECEGAKVGKGESRGREIEEEKILVNIFVCV
jgi:hypothetical protein